MAEATTSPHPVVQTAIGAFIEDERGEPKLTKDGVDRVATALEQAAGADDLVPAIAQLIAFAGFLDRERGLRELAETLLGVAEPWAYVLGKMADAIENPSDDGEEVRHIRRLADTLARKQVLQAPMIDDDVPKDAVRGFELFRPKNFRP